MNILERIRKQLEQLPQDADETEWEKLALKNPSMLSLWVIMKLSEQIANKILNRKWLPVLQCFNNMREHYSRSPSFYPLGSGPVEDLVRKYQQGGISFTEALAISGREEFIQLLSPVYADAIWWKSYDMALSPDWRKGYLFCRVIAESLLAAPLTSAVYGSSDGAVTTLVSVTLFSFKNGGLDDTIYSQTKNVLQRRIALLKSSNDTKSLGKTLHAAATLYSDVYTVIKQADSTKDSPETTLKKWKNEPRVSKTLLPKETAIQTYPHALEALDRAIQLFKHALPYRTGMDKGLTYKAISQCLHYIKKLGGEIDRDELRNNIFLAYDLLQPHENYEHLDTIERIIGYHGFTKDSWQIPLQVEGQEIASSLAVSDEVEHAKAVESFKRILSYNLPFILYLRNFNSENMIHTLGDPVIKKDGGKVLLIDPTISYSLVDHWLLEISPEGIVAVGDPTSPELQRSNLIPKLDLASADWLKIISQIMIKATRIVMLLDEATEGVQQELDRLIYLGVTEKTLLITGQSIRKGQPLPPSVIEGYFPYVVDWIDACQNENYHNQVTKAHAIIQPWLKEFVSQKAVEAPQLIKRWLGQPESLKAPRPLNKRS